MHHYSLLSIFFDIYSEYIECFPQYRYIQEIVRDGVFMYRYNKQQTLPSVFLKQWYAYAYFTSTLLRKLHFPSFYVYRCMHHIRNKTVLRHELPFSTSWNIDVALDWYTPQSTILLFEVNHLLVTYIPSDEDELMVEPSVILKVQKISYDIDKTIDMYFCTCVPLHHAS